jgi:hypothetical protein
MRYVTDEEIDEAIDKAIELLSEKIQWEEKCMRYLAASNYRIMARNISSVKQRHRWEIEQRSKR